MSKLKNENIELRKDQIENNSSMYNILAKYLNHSQMKAVEMSCTSESFVSLIHGPPGTGKTQVILGILSL